MGNRMGCIGGLGIGACFTGGSRRRSGGSDDEGETQAGRWVTPNDLRETHSDDEAEPARRSGRFHDYRTEFNPFSGNVSPPWESPRTSQRWDSNDDLHLTLPNMGDLRINDPNSPPSGDGVLRRLQEDAGMEQTRWVNQADRASSSGQGLPSGRSREASIRRLHHAQAAAAAMEMQQREQDETNRLERAPGSLVPRRPGRRRRPRYVDTDLHLVTPVRHPRPPRAPHQ